MNVRPFTAQQRRVIHSDSGPGPIRFLGIDAKDRPVVQQKERWGDKLQRWSVLKNGDPTTAGSVSRNNTWDFFYFCQDAVARGDSCPSCGARWTGKDKTEMEHNKQCAYIQWGDRMAEAGA